MERASRFCLVTSSHVSNNPRLVKEADSLCRANCSVRVVSLSVNRETEGRDRELAAGRPWRLEHVRAGRGAVPRAKWLAAAARQYASRSLFRAGAHVAVLADHAVSRNLRALANAAASAPADVVLGHNLPALPAAARAARRLGARLGFDCEDLHAEEMTEGPHAALHRALATAVERRWLRACDYLTASSPGIASEIESRYGVARPHVVLNVFPRAMRDRQISQRDRPDSTPTLYWYSQTIGDDRGIEDAMSAAAGLPFPVAVHLRGNIGETYRGVLQSHAKTLGMTGRLFIHPASPPEDLVALAMQHDIGLATEQPVCLNRQLCMTNKLFAYLLAGVAIAATNTLGQREILDANPEVGFTFAPGDVSGMRAGLWSLLASPARLARAKSQSSDAALRRYSWENEERRLVAYLAGVRSGERGVERDRRT